METTIRIGKHCVMQFLFSMFHCHCFRILH